MQSLRKNAAAAMLVVGLGVLGWCVPASALTISVADPSFETLVNPLDGGGHWRPVDNVWNPTSGQSQYQQNTQDNIVAHDGAWSLWVPNTGGVTQDLSTVVSTGETLTLTFWGGNGSHPEFGTNGGGLLTATFLVGATSYSATFDTSTAASGGWAQFTLNEKISNTGDLKISFVNTSGNPWLDDISSVTVVPEPTSFVLAGLGAVGLIAVARRRRKT